MIPFEFGKIFFISVGKKITGICVGIAFNL